MFCQKHVAMLTRVLSHDITWQVVAMQEPIRGHLQRRVTVSWMHITLGIGYNGNWPHWSVCDPAHVWRSGPNEALSRHHSHSCTCCLCLLLLLSRDIKLDDVLQHGKLQQDNSRQKNKFIKAVKKKLFYTNCWSFEKSRNKTGGGGGGGQEEEEW